MQKGKKKSQTRYMRSKFWRIARRGKISSLRGEGNMVFGPINRPLSEGVVEEQGKGVK
jgi:hypothetical protein